MKSVQCVKESLNVVDAFNDVVVLNQHSLIAGVAEECLLADFIINDNIQEMRPFSKSADIKTQANEKADISNKDQFEVINNDNDINLCTRHEVSKENIYSQTIFLNGNYLYT